MSRRLIEAARQLRTRANNAYADATTIADTDSAELVMDLAALVVRLAEESDERHEHNAAAIDLAAGR
jgi:hypothetical protein